MSYVFLSIGSNLGDRMRHLRKAVYLLSLHPDIEIIRVSSVYETDPVGYKKQDDFLNAVLYMETGLSATALLQFTQSVERILKREKTIRNGPRTIDIDILTYDDRVLSTDELTLPHPRMQERAFVQIPLKEILSGGKDIDRSDPTVRLVGPLEEGDEENG